MKNVVNKIWGMIFSSGAFAAIGVIAVLILGQFDTFIAWFFAIVFIGLAAYVARNVYTQTKIMGPMNMISGVHASPDLDNLVPVEGSSQRILNIEQIRSQLNLFDSFKGNSYLNIYGDSNNLSNRDPLYIDNITVKDEGKRILILAEKGIRINVELPEIFTLGKSVFKIFKASSV